MAFCVINSGDTKVVGVLNDRVSDSLYVYTCVETIFTLSFQQVDRRWSVQI